MKKRILVIEDNLTNLELITYLLQAFDYTVFTALDGEKGIQAAEREKPDLIICDVHMPRMDGNQVASYLNENPALCSIPIIAVTALAMVGDREKVLAAGFDGYISKPIIPEQFIQQIQNFIKLKSSPAEAYGVT